nr:PREDICTED: serpin B7-like [Tribolium castaneum]|eukprot:XP_015838239.1 PREDICTED: serpin B7-like [Tribolium castaneum]
MIVVLPKEKDSLSRLENQSETVFMPQHQMQDTLLNIFLPKFHIQSSINFAKILPKLGVRKIFNETEADLRGIGGKKGDLVIDKMVQSLFIDVSKEGVDESVAFFYGTETSRRFEIPTYFIADHPFIFYIKINDLIILARRVSNPSQQFE